jgi:hypothetical protein
MWSDFRRGERVGCPFVGQPLKVTEGLPRELPPCGWSTGFLATPRTVGRRPSQRERPALPSPLGLFLLDPRFGNEASKSSAAATLPLAPKA